MFELMNAQKMKKYKQENGNGQTEGGLRILVKL